jgi:hypothetical protein
MDFSGYVGRLQDVYVPALNLPIRERVDPLLSLFGAGSFASPSTFYFQVLIFAAGSFFWSISRGAKPLDCAFASLLITGVVLLAVPHAPVYLSFHWLPALCAALHWGGSPFVSGLFGIVFVLSAGAFAPLGALVATLAIAKNHVERMLMSVLFLFSVVLLPVYEMPSYPAGARLNPITLRSFEPLPVAGPSLFPDPILASGLEVISGGVVPILLLVILSLLLLSRIPANMKKAQLLGSLSVIGITLFELPAFREQSIFSALSRLVPGVALKPFLPCVLLMILSAIFSLQFWPRRALAVLAPIALCAGIINPFWLPHSAADLLSVRSKEIATSPSGFAVRTFGGWSANGPAATKAKFLKRGKHFEAQLSASVNSDDVELAFDGDKKTRWSTRGPQRGGESLTLRFDRKVELHAVILSVGQSKSDYPRGLLIEAKNGEGSFKTLFEQKNWLGALRWTPEGYVYFGSQSEVIVTLPSIESLTELRITQTGSDPVFDWSIAELKLFGNRPG